LLHAGLLRSVRAGVYRLWGAPVTWGQTVHAAVLAAGAGAAASGTTAAHLHGFLGFDRPDIIELTTIRRYRGPGIRAARAASLPPEDITHRHGIPVTTVARTLCDLASRVPPGLLGRSLDDALRDGAVTYRGLRRCVDRLAAGGTRRGLIRMRAMIDERRAGPGLGDSALEGRVLRILRDAGLPEPATQHRVRLGGRSRRIDIAYPELRIAIEVDSWSHHGRDLEQFHDDRRRNTGLAVGGWLLLQLTDRMTDEEILGLIVAALARHGPPGAQLS
jgi:very-short-patch-repair endonuclease